MFVSFDFLVIFEFFPKIVADQAAWYLVSGGHVVWERCRFIFFFILFILILMEILFRMKLEMDVSTIKFFFGKFPEIMGFGWNSLLFVVGFIACFVFV